MLKKMIGALLVLLLGFSAPAPAYSEPSMIQKQLQARMTYELNDWGCMDIVANDCKKNNLPVPKKVVAMILRHNLRECIVGISFSSYVPPETAYRIAEFAIDSIIHASKSISPESLADFTIIAVPFDMTNKKAVYDGRGSIVKNGEKSYYSIPKEKVAHLLAKVLNL